MEKIDKILDSLYDRVIEPMEAKEQLLDLFAVSDTVCDNYDPEIGFPTGNGKCKNCGKYHEEYQTGR